jgi:hypothetical protein
LAEIYLFPLIAGSLAVGTGWAAGVAAGKMAGSQFIELVVTVLLSSAIYLLAAQMFARHDLIRIRARVASIFHRRPVTVGFEK